MKKLLIVLNLLPVLAFAQAVLPTSWSFVSPSPTGTSAASPTGPATSYTEKPGWTTKLDMAVTGNSPFAYATGSDGNAACRLDATGEYVTIAFAEKPGPLTYYIRGTGTSSPFFTGSFAVQESVDGQSWSAMQTFTSMTSGFTKFTNNPVSASRYVRFFYTTKASGTNVALDSVYLQPAPPAITPNITVKSGSNTLLNNTTFTYGNLSKQILTLANTGISQSLQIDSIVLSGENASDYSIGLYNNNISSSASDTFSVLFNPSANGSRFATVKIYSNDTEKNPYMINLYGIGGNFASEPAQVASLNISNVKTYAMWVGFAKANTEKYIVLRKTGSSITEAPVDGVTYKVGDYIGSSQVAYIGTDTITIKPLYILANTDYSFAAFSYNGPEGYENYNTTNAAIGSTTTLSAQIGNYYANVDVSKNTFITALASRLRSPHDTIFYGNYASTLVGNFLTRDTSGGKKIVNCVYTGLAYVYDGPFYWNGGGPGGMLTREHTFAQSWMPTNGGPGSGWPNVNGREVLEYSDLHHLFPAHQTLANAVRSNNPFGIVVTATSTSPTGYGKLGKDSRNINVYEPKDDQKGNLARALFYMLVRYDGERGNQWRLPTDQEIPLLLQWHQQDPPDALEVARNEYIASVQKNRNPFIDHPEWVNRINFSNMTYIPDASTPTITVTSPVANANVVAGINTAIGWTSANVDSVLVEWQMAPSGPFTTIGKYLASQGSVNYQFNENATNHAVVRISSVANSSVNALSGVFKIVSSSISITKPFENDEYNRGDSIWVKWTKSNVDTVTLIANVKFGTQTNDTLITIKNITTDSFMIGVKMMALGALVHLEIIEQNANKNVFSLSMDTVNFRIRLSDGVKENSLLNDKVSVYPVPSNGLVYVTTNDNVVVKTIQVYDVVGRLLQTTNNTNVTLSTKGVYFLQVITNKGTATKRVVVE